jgi:tetratricopeptide (TPR) repeat protein
MFIPAGAIIDNKFEIQRSIGSGGMGVVYECRQVSVDRLVALKFLTYAPSADPREQARFEREARILSRLSHSNIVQFYAYGSWKSYPYIAMERLSGRSLHELLPENGSILDQKLTLQICIQVCLALAHAHAQDIFHRDIKPSNILIECADSTSSEPHIKLIDFGVAKITGIDGQQKLTQTGMAIGSVLYMSPEQCMGLPVGAGTDIYALGCVLFECFTGEAPFLADNGVAVMFQHMNDPISRSAKWNSLSRDQQHIIAKCLAKQPSRRYGNTNELREDLEALLAGTPPRSAPARLSGDRLDAGSGTKIRRRWSGVIGTICGAVMLLAVVNYYNGTHWGDNTPPPPAAGEPRQAYLRGVQLLDTAQPAEAVKHLQRANELADAHRLPVDQLLSCDIKLALARALGETGDYQTPLKLLDEVSARSARFNPGYRATVAYQQADAWTNIFEEEKALLCAQEATSLWENEFQALDGPPPFTAYQQCFAGWSRVARAQSALQRQSQAELSRRKALDYARRAPGDNSGLVFAGTLALAEVLCMEKKLKAAETLLKDLQQGKSKLKPAERSPSALCRIVHLKGQIEHDRHQYAAAERTFASSLPIAEKIVDHLTRRHYLGYIELQRALCFYPAHDITHGDQCLARAQQYWSDAPKSFPQHIYLNRAREARKQTLKSGK